MGRVPGKRRWLVWGGTAVALAVAVAAATPLLVPVDRYRPLLEQYLSFSTGRQVQIGSLRLDLWPRVHVHATDVRLLNPAGFPRGNAIEARSVDLGIEPRALLARRLEIRTIAISNVQVNVLSDATGRTNYDTPVPAHPAAPATTNAPSGGQPFIGLAPIGAISVKNVALAVGTVNMPHGQTAPVVALTGLNATVGVIDPNASDWASRLRITADLKRARIVTPFLTVPAVVQSGEIQLLGGRGTATFALTLGTMRASGTATIVRLSPPLITFAATMPELDLRAVQRAMNGQAGSTAAGPSGPRRLIARGAVAVGHATLPPLNATQIHSNVSIYTDVVRADTYRLSAYGGTVRGNALLNYAEARLPTVAVATVRGVDVAALVRALAPQNPRMTGALEANLDLSTAFGGDPLAALTGTGTFAVRNGSFPGINVPGRLAQMAKTVPLSTPAGDTQFSYFGGDVRIARERVYSTALRLDAEGMRGTAQGSVGFDGTLDYTGTGVFALSSGAGAVLSPAALLSRLVPGAAGATTAVVPFSIRGSVDNPNFAMAGVPRFTGGQASGSQQPSSGPSIPGVPPALQNVLHPP